ncbi:MAG: DUF4252 domain-containing protein [Flavobacteriales bacterium]
MKLLKGIKKYYFIGFFLLISCSKEKQHLHYEAFQENKIQETQAKQISVPIFLAEKIIPAKYENQKKLLTRVKKAEIFISEDDDKKFDQELETALKNDDFKPLLHMKSMEDFISIYHKKSLQKDLYDFVVYVNDSKEKIGLNFTTDITPEELTELLKTAGIDNLQKIKEKKEQLKNILKQY